MAEALEELIPDDEDDDGAPKLGHLRERPYSNNASETQYLRDKLQEIANNDDFDIELSVRCFEVSLSSISASRVYCKVSLLPLT